MTAYYNENDPYAAAWLRNLIAAGHIPAGEVDDRSIVDVRAADLAGFDQCHFFAGIGGWPYALELAGWHGPVWTGSCPCQPLSSAGQRRGHADERHLWASFWADAVWLPCLDGKARRVEPGIFPLAHGVSSRVGRLRAHGNAITPQAAAAFVKAFLAAR